MSNQLQTTSSRASISTMPLRQVATVQEMLVNNQARSQLAAVAASNMRPERMMRIMANSIRVTPKLAQCSPLSLLGAMMQCASLGLEPNTVLGHCYLIPFDKKKYNRQTKKWETVSTDVQLVVGYKGLIDLARRSGHISSISAGIHYSDDTLWEYEEGTEAKLRHRPGDERGVVKGDRLHAYAIAKMKDGGHAWVVLPWSEIEKTRDNSEGYKSAMRYGKPESNPWGSHLDAMAKKTAIRQLAKYLPLSVEFNSGMTEALTHDETESDYRAFAMNPDEGLHMIEQQGEDPLEETQQDPEPENAAEKKRPAKKEATPRRKAGEPRTDATPYADEGKQEAQREDPKEYDGDGQASMDMGAAPDHSHYDSLVSRIVGELMDGTSPEVLMEDFKELIEKMKVEAPLSYKDLKDEFIGFDPDLADKL